MSEADGKTKGTKYPEYDINGYRKDHRVKNLKFTSKFDNENSTDGKEMTKQPKLILRIFSDSKPTVDLDWIDIKANNYFNNEEYQANKKVTGSKKPEWQNVYSKDNIAPAEGAVNAFQIQDL